MNTKRITFWAGFFIIIGLIVWGLIVAMNKPAKEPSLNLGTPAPISTPDHATGPESAPVTIIEYSDFQCPACEMYHPVIEQLLASSTVPIRFSYRQFPLSSIHKNAIPASMASEAASAQGKFWDMYHLIFNNHTDWTELADPTKIFVGYATDLGLDITKFKADLGSTTLRAHIDADVKEGESIGINSTPTFFVNGKAIINPQSYEAFKTLIEETAKNSSK